MTVRLPDWDDRLARAILDARATPFGWGSHDCCLFVADVTLALTGADPAAALRGKYSSETEAWELLRSLGITNHVHGILQRQADALGFREVAPELSRRGDWVFAIGPGRNLVPCGGIDTGERIACVTSPAGYTLLPRTSILKAWHVPFPDEHPGRAGGR